MPVPSMRPTAALLHARGRTGRLPAKRDSVTRLSAAPSARHQSCQHTNSEVQRTSARMCCARPRSWSRSHPTPLFASYARVDSPTNHRDGETCASSETRAAGGPKGVESMALTVRPRGAAGSTHPTVLGERFVDALAYATRVHRGQTRRDSPYVAHLLRVAGLVLEDGGTENEAIGALLHDAAEDQGGHERLADIRRRYGARGRRHRRRVHRQPRAAAASSGTRARSSTSSTWRRRRPARCACRSPTRSTTSAACCTSCAMRTAGPWRLKPRR